jgi:hypothetical protein
MSELKENLERNYEFICNIIRQYGTPCPQYPQDIEIPYRTLREHVQEKIGGIPALLKNMKDKKLVDYTGPLIKDDTMIVLVNEYYQPFKAQYITYEQINEKIQFKPGDQSSHTKTGGW